MENLSKKEVIKLLRKIAEDLRTEINDEYGPRKFDIVDFYTKYGEHARDINKHVGYNELKDEGLEESDISLIRNLLGTRSVQGPMTDPMIEEKMRSNEKASYINGTHRFNCDRDERGYPIPGTGEIIPTEEKISWFIRFEKYGIPETRGNIRTMETRYILSRLRK